MTPPDVEIVRADQDTLDAVVDCWVHLAEEQRAYGSDVEGVSNRDAMRATLGAHMVDDGLLVAKSGDSVVGFASFSVQRGALELERTRGTLTNLYVVPSRRGDAIGTALLERVESDLRDRGVSVVLLEAMAQNAAARRFYERAGYEPFRVSYQRSLEVDGSEKNDTHSKEEG